jgi:catechol 2,3-dioxygenase-like lactoylglutathione lyase family enzyme
MLSKGALNISSCTRLRHPRPKRAEGWDPQVLIFDAGEVTAGMARPSIVQIDTNENRKENMIDHVILTVSDFNRSVAFYAKALKPLGITTLIDYEGKDGHPDLKGFGNGKRHFFWLKEGKPDPQAVHVGFAAKDHSEVDAFYKAALAAGEKGKESPQARLEYYPGYYATWVLDPDGHDIEVVNKS